MSTRRAGLVSISPDLSFSEDGEIDWDRFYDELRPYVASLVSLSKVPSWQGQENDLVEDILQETVIRLFRQIKQSKNEPSIVHIKAFARTIARNICFDLQRKERRLVQLPEGDHLYEIASMEKDDPIEAAFEVLTERELIAKIAPVIASLPNKQRTALLIDLALRTTFEREPSWLEQALKHEAIDLRSYQTLLPKGRIDRARHSALVSIAYKRLQEAVSSLLDADIDGDTQPSEKEDHIMELARQENTSLGRHSVSHSQEKNQVALDSLHYLEEPYRSIVRLHYEEKRTYKDIAATLDLPIGTVKSYASRGLQKLQQAQKLDAHPTTTTEDKELFSKRMQISERLESLVEPYYTSMRLYLEGKSYTQIAVELGKPLGTVKSLIHRASQRLLKQNTLSA